MAAPQDERYQTVAEAARELDVSPSTIWRWIDAKLLPAQRVGARKIRIRREDLARMVAPARSGTGRDAGTAEIRPASPAPEDLKHRQELGARLLELRKRLVIAPLTTTDLLDEVDRERQERHESWIGVRR